MLEQVNGNWNVGELVYPCMSVKVRIMSNMITDKKALRLFFIITIIMSVIFEGGYIISSYVKGTQSLLIMLGHVMMTQIEPKMTFISFQTMSGELTVEKSGDLFTYFPTRASKPVEMPELLEKALGCRVLETTLSRDMVALVESEKIVKIPYPDSLHQMREL